jgi:iron(III) transport system ATP-binding protein
MAFIEIKNLFKQYKKVTAVNRINLEVNKGELLTLLGPSGCGKTTTLRCIAGLEKPEDGDIIIDGNSMISQSFVQPSKRGIGMMFQNYAVWPHMKVYSNIVYGLKLQKISKQDIKKKAKDVLELVGLQGLEDRYPGQLSGGQQQRVALARALIRNPKVLLLDEPLSNLDAKLREKMRFEIKSLVKRMGITSVYVTHDQAEAMVISDRVVVMEKGNIVQTGSPQEIYQKPASRFVADFIGAMNFLPGEVIEAVSGTDKVYMRTEFGGRLLCSSTDSVLTAPGRKVYASIRPEDVEVVLSEPVQARDNIFRGTIENKAYLGNFLFLFIKINDTVIRVQAPHLLSLEEGKEINFSINPEKCMVLPE